jgi:hypothetical protein
MCTVILSAISGSSGLLAQEKKLENLRSGGGSTPDKDQIRGKVPDGMLKKHQVFPVLLFPIREKVERSVVDKISFEVKETINILLTGWCLL